MAQHLDGNGGITAPGFTEYSYLRFLSEERGNPLHVAIVNLRRSLDSKIKAYESDSNKLVMTTVAIGLGSLAVAFPVGLATALAGGAIAAPLLWRSQIMGAADKLKVEQKMIRQSQPFLQFIQEIAEYIFQNPQSAQRITPEVLLTAYEATLEGFAHNDHNHQNAADPVSCLFLLNLRSQASALPEWLVQRYQYMERSELERRQDLEAAEQRMMRGQTSWDAGYSNWQPGQTTQLGAIEVPSQALPTQLEGEQSLGKSSPPVFGTDEGRENWARLPEDPLPTTGAEVLQRLKAECPELLRLLKSQPIRAVGTQRTGKTTLVKKLALLRLLLLPNHQVIASTPHYEPDNPYPSVFQVVGTIGTKRNYGAIEHQWNAMAQRIEECQRNSITTVWDEFGLFNKVMGEEQLTSVLTSSLREATKHGEYPVFIVHGETQAFLPGSRGLVTVFLASTVRVETIGELTEGADGLEEMKPTGKFRVTWLDGSRGEGQIPDWLTEEFLISIGGFEPFKNSERSGSETTAFKPEPIENDRVPALNPEPEPLKNSSENVPEPTQHSTPNPAELPPIADPFAPEISSELFDRIVLMRLEQTPIALIIERVWGVKKGGSKAYAAAKEKLNIVLTKAGIY